MKLDEVINPQWLDAQSLSGGYQGAEPFPHIVMRNFIRDDVLAEVTDEFPDLAKCKDSAITYNNEREIKLAGKGMGVLSPSAMRLNAYLQSDLFLEWLNTLTGIEEPLISDPYLSGAGYHEIKSGGLLKVHVDFNKHPKLDLDRRLNMLIYLNRDWDENWGGELQLFGESMREAARKVPPVFNTAVIFTTTSFTYHGHPDPLRCPDHRSRRSLAYYYFSTGRPEHEVSADTHSTLFKERVGEKFEASGLSMKSIVRDLTPPILVKAVKRLI